MKNAFFYFTLKALFVHKILTFLYRLFGHVEKRLDLKDNVNFKIYDVKIWETNNCNIVFTIFKRHLLKQIKQIFFEGESPT